MNVRVLRWVFVACCVAVLVAAGCAKSSEGDTVTVTIKDLRFNPPTVTVKPGGTVRWVNKDTTAHTSTSSDFNPDGKSPASAWNSPVLDPGKSWSRKFENEGDFTYACSIHPYIKGTVKVQR